MSNHPQTERSAVTSPSNRQNRDIQIQAGTMIAILLGVLVWAILGAPITL